MICLTPSLCDTLPYDTVQVRVESNKAMDLLVMENVFYERSLAPVYDLKGSERARWCKDDPSDPTTVLLDENLKRDILSAPLLVGVSVSCHTQV